ncbi:PAS domain S-box protein [Caballeronia glebae]|uniref:Diguanylate cyclase with PAS/PAC sensor n=1 Tax=Caballeronia glebae TaxID=1777143 RepID=A0A158CZT6_9BURK|nr:PAS domain S-box protein [Caballeronia glebae]SAK87751.1 diguanylate cyclase with PAS/PAC sensor [Caballeronia glebae]
MADTAALDTLIVGQAPDALICSDREGAIIRWNTAAEALFGYRADEALGQSLDLIIPPHLRAAHWRGFNQAMESGATKHHGHAVMTGATHKDGTRIYAEVAFSLVKTDTGEVTGAVAIARPKKREA